MRDEKDDQMTHWRMVAARGIVRNYGQIWANNNSPATGELIYTGAVILAISIVTLAVGLIRTSPAA